MSATKIHDPIVNGWYADPEARKYGDRYYIWVTGSNVKNNPDAFPLRILFTGKSMKR